MKFLPDRPAPAGFDHPVIESLAALGLAALIAAPIPARAEEALSWIGTWSASPQRVWGPDFVLPTGVPPALENRTIRQIARISLGGRRIRIVLSNAYGSKPLVIGAAHVALGTSATEAIVAGSGRVVTFGGSRTVTIPPGAPVISDPVDLAVPPLASVAVSLFLPDSTPVETFHWDGRQTAGIVAGNHVGAATIDPDETISARIALSGILVEASQKARAVVVLGDSITDGNGSTPDADRRWPDHLAERLVESDVAVLNAGISGARLLASGMGENALARFDRDVLGRPGVAAVVVLLGINDIGWPGGPFAPEAPAAEAEEIIAGYRQLIGRAHARGVRIVGATLLPFEGALEGTELEGHYSPAKEEVRQAVNAWIRTSGAFDAVIDFDAVTRDPDHPRRLLPAYDSGDHLHPGDAGYRAMAEAIDLETLFGSR